MVTRSFLKPRPFHTNLYSFLLVLPNEQLVQFSIGPPQHYLAQLKLVLRIVYPIVFEGPAISHHLVQSSIGYPQ